MSVKTSTDPNITTRREATITTVDVLIIIVVVVVVVAEVSTLSIYG
jgi:hypothetical protein